MDSLTQATVVSVRVALGATVVASMVAIPVAYLMRRRRGLVVWLLEAALLLPLALPPTVVGFALVSLLGRRGVLQPVWETLGIRGLIFTEWAAVIAAAIVAMPLIYLPSRAAFSAIDREWEDHAKLMGASSFAVWWHVALPTARQAIGAGLLLGFARCLGEFGATIMVLGDRTGSQTLPISVYGAYISGEAGTALPAVLMLTCLSLAAVLLYNRGILRRSH